MRHQVRASLFVAAGAASAVQAGLVAYYPFNGNANDASGNGNHAISVNATLVAGYQGQGYLFSGANTGIQIPIDINPSAMPDLTMGAWVKFNGTGFGRQGILSHDNGNFDRTLGFDGRDGLSIENPTKSFSAFAGPAGGVLNSGSTGSGQDEWTFLAAVYSGSTVTLYVNDEPAVSAAATPGPGFTTTFIGVNPFSSTFEWFGGAVDEVFFFDEALDERAITQIRENGIPAPGSALVAGLGIAAAGRRRRG